MITNDLVLFVLFWNVKVLASWSVNDRRQRPAGSVERMSFGIARGA